MALATSQPPAVRILRMGEGPTVDEGPLKAYLTMFPERELRWNKWRERWEIFQHNPVTGDYEWYTSLWEWVDQVDPETGEVDRVKGYRPFDWRYVREVRRDWYRMRHEGIRRMAEERAKKAERIKQQTKDYTAGEVAAGYGEVRNWFPVQAEYQRTGRWMPGLRTPTVPTGIDLKKESN